MPRQKAMLIDIKRCIGCLSCETACKQLHGFSTDPEPTLSDTAFTVVETPRRQVRPQDLHALRRSGLRFGLPGGRDQQVAARPGALQRRQMHWLPLLHDWPARIRCRVISGPSSRRSSRSATLCSERIKTGGQPACVEACPVQASVFGNRDELIAEAWNRIRGDSSYVPQIYGLEEAGGASVLFVSDVPFEKLGFKAAPNRQPADADTHRQRARRLAQGRHHGRHHSLGAVLGHAAPPRSSARRSRRESGHQQDERGRELAMIARIKSEITLWRVIVAIIFVTGMYATYVRFFVGFRASTNLSDQMPWGLWVGLGTLCGIGLSAAGFGISAAVYLLGMERYRPILRASILISFLGYLTVCVGYFYEIGLPWRFWHPIVMWNHNSVLFDVCVCIMTYTTVLTFEFAPAVIEKLPWKRFRETVLHFHHKILIGVVLAGVLLSSMHQSYLGGLYLIARGKVHPLWYSQYMHAMFYLSAIPAGLALTVMAIYLCMRSLNVRVDFSILSDCGRMIQLLLIVFAFFKVLDLVANQALGYAFQRTSEAGYFWLEMVLFLVIPDLRC